MIKLGPELLVGHVQELKPALVEALRACAVSGDPLTLHCGSLQAFDAAGLQLLVTLAMSLRERGTSLRLHDCPPGVRQRIEGVALHEWFEFEQPEAA